MGATAAVHPADPILQAYGLGKLDDISSESVSKHIEGCDPCQRRVAELSSDEFLGRLRVAQGQPEVSATDWERPLAAERDRGASATVAPPSAETMPPGLADHADYDVIKELGRGGMGVVYLAHNRLMGRNEVLKVMSRHIMERPGLLARFLAEIRAVARLQHPNIVTAYSAFRLGESIIFAMEYVEGLDLARMVKSKGPLPVIQACYFVSQAAQGMQHAHDEGMVHRDIKPGNLMLSHKGGRAMVKVLDFGLAKATRDAPLDGGLTNPGQALGTPDYMAPEQIRDAQKADIRADIYSLGCTLYYLLSGGPPFHAENLWDLYQAHHSMDARLLNFVRSDVPGELAALVAKMMAKEPERRFQTPAQVVQALAPFFKKASTNLRPFNPELSRAEQSERTTPARGIQSAPTQPATGLVSPAAAPDAKASRAARLETRWESLIEFKETEPLRAPVPRAATAAPERPKWIWRAAVAGLLLMGLVVAWGMVIRLTTPKGTIVLENVPEDAVVEIDGETIAVHPPIGEPIEIKASAGKHGLVVRRGDLVLLAESVTLEAGKQFKLGLSARLEPPVDVRRKNPEPPATPQPTEPGVPEIAGRSQFSMLSGRWHAAGAELVQEDATRSFSTVMFGDDRWVDYAFSVDVMRVGGSGSFALLFRGSDPGNGFEYVISADEDKKCHFVARIQETANTLRRYDYRLMDRTWYTARVHCRGGHLICSIYDNFNATETRVFDLFDERHPKGRVGLQTFGSAFRFKNIKVTAPDGKALWTGPPPMRSSEKNKNNGAPRDVAANNTSFPDHARTPAPTSVAPDAAFELGEGRPTFLAPFRKQAPVINGVIAPDEYGRRTEFDFANDSHWGALAPAMPDARTFKRRDDLSVSVSTAYSIESLFLGIHVLDRNIDDDQEDRERPWCNDSIEIYIDGDRTSNDFRHPRTGKLSGSSEGFRLGVDAAGHRWSDQGDVTNRDWRAAAKRTDDGYVIEVEIPLVLIDTRDGPEKRPAGPGSLFNFALSITDNDANEHRQMSFAFLRANNTVRSPFQGGEDSWSFGIKLAPGPESATSTRNDPTSSARKNPAPGNAAKSKVEDAFELGTIWVGKRVLSIEGTPKPVELASSLIVRDRQGQKFTAHFALGTDMKFEVKGTVEGRRIRWVSGDVKAIEGVRGPEPLDYAYVGTIQDEHISMTISGIDTHNRRRISGTLKVRLQK